MFSIRGLDISGVILFVRIDLVVKRRFYIHDF